MRIIFLLLLFACSCNKCSAEEQAAYVVPTSRYSYFALDAEGKLILQNGFPYRDEREYFFQRSIAATQTALVVMDPWVDSPTAHLREHFVPVLDTRVVPLVNSCLAKGHPVIVLTNNPAGLLYSKTIHPALATLVGQGKITKLYHDAYDDDALAAYLRGRGINTLIYCGLSSNVCVIGRKTGMIPMVQQGFKIYYVPEASAAVEFAETWGTGENHRHTTRIVSQWVAELVDCDDLIQGQK